jgi:hypothetical protein
VKYSVAVCLFPDNRGTTFLSPDIWAGRLMAKLETDPDCHSVDLWYKELGDTPITMLRNRALKDCERRGIDYVMFIDSDNKPDLYVGIDPEAKPFWESSFAFMRAHAGPCVVAAPYCGSPPDEGVHAFRWVSHESQNPNPDFALKTITRHEAVYMRGIQKCAAAATGVMLIDMRGVKLLDHPRFDYEWKDKTMCQKASTEDVYFTRNLNYVGVPTYINWDSWAGHLKVKMVGKPVPIHQPSVTRQLRREAKAMVNGHSPAHDAAVRKLAETLQGVQATFEATCKALHDLHTEGAVASQEPPVRVGINHRATLPPTADPALVTPAGMTMLHAGDEEAYGSWREGRRADLLAESATDAEGPKDAAALVAEQIQRETADQAFIENHPVKSPAEEAFERAYPEAARNGAPTTPGQP